MTLAHCGVWNQAEGANEVLLLGNELDCETELKSTVKSMHWSDSSVEILRAVCSSFMKLSIGLR